MSGAKFVQISTVHDGAGGANLYALDADGVVWKYSATYNYAAKAYDECWTPLGDTRALSGDTERLVGQ